MHSVVIQLEEPYPLDITPFCFQTAWQFLTIVTCYRHILHEQHLMCEPMLRQTQESFPKLIDASEKLISQKVHTDIPFGSL